MRTYKHLCLSEPVSVDTSIIWCLQWVADFEIQRLFLAAVSISNVHWTRSPCDR